MTAGPAHPSILVDLAMVLGVAAITTVTCQRFRVPVVLGYLIAGFIVGPYLPIPLVADQGNVHTLSELGVILLMFSLGIEFSFKKLMRAGPSATMVAVIQAGFLTWAGYLGGRFLGMSTTESIFAGTALSISSTMIIGRVFDNLQIKGPLAELVLASLIVEDLLAIILLTLLTVIGSGSGLGITDLLKTLVRLFGFLAIVLPLGRWLVARFVRWVADEGNDETFLVTVVGLCFTLSWLASRVGYSVALGAFLAGMIVAESGRERKAEHLVIPLRDTFVAVFFVSIGMMIDPSQLLPNWKALLVFGTLVVVGKFMSASVGALLGGNTLRLSLRTGASLAQIGEFSFIIVALGQSLGVVGPALLPVMIATCAWTTLTTPFMIQHSDALADRIEKRLPKRFRLFLMHHRAAMGHLGAIPFRKDSWKHLRKPFGYLIMDALMVTLAALVASMTHSMLARHLVQGFITLMVAEFVVWFVAGALAIRFLVGMWRQIRIIAGGMAERALPSGTEAAEGMEEAIQFGLEVAIGFLLVLPMIALLQPFFPTLLMSSLVFLGLLAFGVIFWHRIGAIQARKPEDGDAGTTVR